MPPPDPSALFREMLGQWEAFTNQVGGEAMKTEEFARAMHGANAATMQGQEALKGVTERALAAANMPSRADVEDLSARLARVEASLARIEDLLTSLAGAPKSRNDRPRPSRTRKPPSPGGET